MNWLEEHEHNQRILEYSRQRISYYMERYIKEGFDIQHSVKFHETKQLYHIAFQCHFGMHCDTLKLLTTSLPDQWDTKKEEK